MPKVTQKSTTWMGIERLRTLPSGVADQGAAVLRAGSRAANARRSAETQLAGRKTLLRFREQREQEEQIGRECWVRAAEREEPAALVEAQITEAQLEAAVVGSGEALLAQAEQGPQRQLVLRELHRLAELQRPARQKRRPHGREVEARVQAHGRV